MDMDGCVTDSTPSEIAIAGRAGLRARHRSAGTLSTTAADTEIIALARRHVLAMQPLSLTFTDPELEAKYRAKRFRQAYVSHQLFGLATICVYSIGARDPTYKPVALPCAATCACIVIMRWWLHEMADHRHAQRLGAVGVLCLTTFAWVVRSAVAHSLVGSISNVLIAPGLACILLAYPLVLATFMPSPTQHIFMVVTAIAGSCIQVLCAAFTPATPTLAMP